MTPEIPADDRPEKAGFNLSEWALEHRSFVWFLMLVSLLAGIMAYRGLGREEDPPFAIKTMIVVANWPGATVAETMDQVTDRIEKELQQIDALDYTKSYTTPGHTTVFVQLKDTIDYQKKSRRCYCCMVVILIIIVLAVTIGVGSFFGVKKNSARMLLRA